MHQATAWVAGIMLFGCVEPPAPLAWNPGRAEIVTTNGALAIGNLSSQIESADREVQRQPQCVHCLVALANLLLTRAQLTGAPSDLDRALVSAKAAVALSRDGATLLGLARAKAALHLFEEARNDAWTAALLRAPAPEAFGLLASIDEATGHSQDATRYWQAAVQERADTNRLAHLAVLIAATRDMDRASELFNQAAGAYRDVSPFPIAWLELQEGLGWQAVDHIDRARVLFQRAHDRLPQSPAIASHLAAVELDPDQAIALLEPFAHAEDPEAGGQLASLLALRHRAEEANALATDVSRRYDALLEKHPEAYADHAARFWLSAAGHAPRKALRWARVNLLNRDTPAAWALFREATAAAPKGETTAAVAASVSF